MTNALSSWPVPLDALAPPRSEEEWRAVAESLERAVREGRMTEEECHRVSQQLLGAGPASELHPSPSHAAPAVLRPTASGREPEPPALAGPPPTARQRRSTARRLRRAVFERQLDQGQYLRRMAIVERAQTEQQLTGLVGDLPLGRRRSARGVLSLTGVVLLGLTVGMLVVDFLLLAVGVSPGMSLVVPTACLWGLSVLVALAWLPLSRREPAAPLPH